MNYLVKKFIKTPDEIATPKVRAAYGKLSGWVGILCNLLLFLVKIVAGLLSGSVATMADALNNFSDAASSIVTLAGFKLAEKPADKEHPYGHGRYEYLSAMVVAVIIIVIGVELFITSIKAISSPSKVEFSLFTVTVLVFSILLKLWMMGYNNSIGKKINSSSLKATAIDSRNDVITSLVVLVSGLVSYFTALRLDGWAGVFVAIFIIYGGFGLVRETMDPLLGKAPDAQLVESLREKILSYPSVRDTHDLMVHDYGPGRQFASVHVEMPAEQDVVLSHRILDKIERAVLAEYGVQIVAHLDPIDISDSGEGGLRAWLLVEVKAVDSRFTIHDIVKKNIGEIKRISFDCVVPQDFDMQDEEIVASIEKRINAKKKSYVCRITIDRSYIEISKEF